MKMTKVAATTLVLATIGLGGALLSPMLQLAAFSQALPLDDQGPPPQGDGGPGGPPPSFGGGRRPFGGPPPFTMGTVTAVDSAAKTITIASPMGGQSQTIQTSDTTQVVSQVTATVADLKTGDKVQVQGVPTGITVSSLTAGQSPFDGGPGGFPGGPGGFGGGRGPGGGAAPASFAMATGTVTATSPLTISLGSGATLTLKMAADAKVTKFSTVALSGIKAGDRIMSMGQAGADGVFTASTVGVNVTMNGPGGFGRGGFGGRGFGQGRRGYGRRGQPDPNAPAPPPPAEGVEG